MTDPEIIFSRHSRVTLTEALASDLMVVQAARVSTQGAESLQTEESAGLIDYLMKSRHGSPFEAGYFRFLIETPIFVAREFQRHRFASYSEMSGRYVEMKPEFYVVDQDRPLVQVGKPGSYQFEKGSDLQFGLTEGTLITNAVLSWKYYQTLLEKGVAREVARMILPLNTFTAFYVSMNPRGLTNFLSLRVKSEDASYPTYPMHEIHEVAEMMEGCFADQMPHTYKAFVKHGRVAP